MEDNIEQKKAKKFHVGISVTKSKYHYVSHPLLQKSVKKLLINIQHL